MIERRALQVVVAIACLIPFSVAIPSVLHGVVVAKGMRPPVPIDLDSHFRYLSGIFLALGAMVVTGGLARALSWAQLGAPSIGHRLGLVMEIGVVPLLMLWQWRVERTARLT